MVMINQLNSFLKLQQYLAFWKLPGTKVVGTQLISLSCSPGKVFFLKLSQPKGAESFEKK